MLSWLKFERISKKPKKFCAAAGHDKIIAHFGDDKGIRNRNLSFGAELQRTELSAVRTKGEIPERGDEKWHAELGAAEQRKQ
jgi:hypothetical protein